MVRSIAIAIEGILLHGFLELSAMTTPPDQNSLHRTAKYFMDDGRADSAESALALLGSFGLTVRVGEEIVASAEHQTALLTLVNVTSRTLLGGVEVVGLPDVPSATRLASNGSLRSAVEELGGKIVSEERPDWPRSVIGTVNRLDCSRPCWQLTWEGWRGGVIPWRENGRLRESGSLAFGPALAAAVCGAEVFAFHAKDHPMAGCRASGLSLWRPGTDWRRSDPSEPTVAYLPSQLWIIGLGNLGQAFAWVLGSLPYPADPKPLLVLQDFDRVMESNVSTSLLTFPVDVGRKKARVVAEWAEARGFETVIEERRFGPSTRRADDEPAAALCGVDNALARSRLEGAGFGLVIEAGLGAGPGGFRCLSQHSFPGSRPAAEIWSDLAGTSPEVQDKPAYRAMKKSGMDQCGVARLAARTVAVPFVGLTAACLVISELLRRLHGGEALELASLSLLSVEDVETVPMEASPYDFGFVPAVGIPADVALVDGERVLSSY